MIATIYFLIALAVIVFLFISSLVSSRARTNLGSLFAMTPEDEATHDDWDIRP